LKNRYQLLERHRKTQKKIRYKKSISNEVEERNFDFEQFDNFTELVSDWFDDVSFI
jgi:hypothetical protein